MDIITYLHQLPQNPANRYPLIALGIFERVGSNWFLDAFSTKIQTYNEPYRQQIGNRHPISSLSPHLQLLKSTVAETMSPYERFWLEEFYASKLSPTPQLIKETNLFFALENLLDIFSESHTVIVSRHPAGIADSFAKRNLFDDWEYAKRYTQVRKMVKTARYERFFTAKEYTNPLAKLGYLIALQAVITTAYTAPDTIVVPYEATDEDRAKLLLAICTKLHIPYEAPIKDNSTHTVTSATFTTTEVRTSEERRTTSISRRDYAVVEETIYEVLHELEVTLGTIITDRAINILFSYGNYSFIPPQAKPAPVPITPHTSPVPYQSETITPLVTNTEFCHFLNELRRHGVHNQISNMNFLFNENMLEARGGRIIFSHNRYEVVPGYNRHPVYWVTWFGAALYAAYRGTGLPTFSEFTGAYTATTCDLAAINASYRHGDTVTVDSDENSLIGNLASWCQDGPETHLNHPNHRYISGIAWNKPATLSELSRQRQRSVIDSSRAVGIRMTKPVGATDITAAVALAQKYLQIINKDGVIY